MNRDIADPIALMNRDVVVEILRLCPGDNLGQRSWMGSILLQAGRNKDALHFSQRWLEKKTRHDGTSPQKAGCDFETEPSKTPLSRAEIDDMTEWTPACHMYTAAFAAFKLWGDCELARQYYKLAIKLNPNVMIKILARVTQPSTQSFLPKIAHPLLFHGHDFIVICCPLPHITSSFIPSDIT